MRVLSSMATHGLLAELIDDLRVTAGVEVALEFGGGVVVAERVRGGDPADVVVLAQGALEGLAADGHVLPTSLRSLFVSETVVAVPSGAGPPPLEGVDDLRLLLLGAQRIGYSTGPSGEGLLRMLDDWGVLDHLAPRLSQAPAGTPVATLLASGVVSVAVQQRSEFEHVDGVQVVGALPPGCEVLTVFAGAVAATTANESGARRLLDALSSEANVATVRRHAMEPATL
jgi:molybdate transport system substrate-binding protein